MKNSSQLGWILAVGGIGLVGFYLFNKNKPTIAKEQLSSIDSELGTIKVKSEEKSKTLDQLGSDVVASIANMTEAQIASLINMDFSNVKADLTKDSLGLNTSLSGSYDISIERMDARIANEFPMPIPMTPTDAYVCIKLDVLLRNITLKIEDEQRKVIARTAGNDQQYVNGLQRRKSVIEMVYNSSSCPSKIEVLRLNESGLLLTKGAIVQENLISSKSNTDQQIYIGVGALVTITGLYMILKK